MEPDFSPQLIQFSGQTKSEKAPILRANYGPSHAHLETLMELFSEDPFWQSGLQERMLILESHYRCDWIKAQIKVLKQGFSDLIDWAEVPGEVDAEAIQTARQKLQDHFKGLRQGLQSEYLPLLRERQKEQQVIQALIMAQLNRLDALQLMSAAAFEKAVLISEQRRQELVSVGKGVLPDELLLLLELEELLDAAARYQFAWNRMASKPKAEALQELQEIALKGLRPGTLPASKPHPAGTLLDWQGDKLFNGLGVAIEVYKKPYLFWMKMGIQRVQLAMKEKFQRSLPLEQALEAFYAALSVQPERVDAALALAWIMALLDQPVYALDFLEYCLRLEARPEIQSLYRFLQEHTVHD